MVIQGVATRRDAKITENLCGSDFSKSQVSAICKRLDTEIQAWLNRSLEESYPYVFMDASYEKIRRDHKQKAPVIVGAFQHQVSSLQPFGGAQGRLTSAAAA